MSPANRHPVDQLAKEVNMTHATGQHDPWCHQLRHLTGNVVGPGSRTDLLCWLLPGLSPGVTFAFHHATTVAPLVRFAGGPVSYPRPRK
jgi:hypothetical protein